MLPRPLNAALYHTGDIGRARAAARVLRIFRGSSSRKPDDEVIRDVSRRPPTRRYVEFLGKVFRGARFIANFLIHFRLIDKIVKSRDAIWTFVNVYRICHIYQAFITESSIDLFKL